MPTDFFELGIAAACIVSMTLARSRVLEPRDGLSASALAASLSSAITLVLILASIVMFALGARLPQFVMPFFGIACCAIIAALLTLALKKSAGAALQRLLTPLLPAILICALLLSAASTPAALAHNLLNQTLFGAGLGFSFALLLQLSVILNTTLETLIQTRAQSLSILQAPSYRHALTMLLAVVLSAITTIAISGWW